MFETDPTNYQSGGSFRNDNYKNNDFNNREFAERVEDGVKDVMGRRHNSAYEAAFANHLLNPFDPSAKRVFFQIEKEYQQRGWLDGTKVLHQKMLK
jgi:hypothetical protein